MWGLFGSVNTSRRVETRVNASTSAAAMYIYAGEPIVANEIAFCSAIWNVPTSERVQVSF